MTQRKYNNYAKRIQEYTRAKKKMYIQAEREGWTQDEITKQHKELVKQYKV